MSVATDTLAMMTRLREAVSSEAPWHSGSTAVRVVIALVTNLSEARLSPVQEIRLVFDSVATRR